MRVFASLLATSAALASSVSLAAPTRVASLNLCTDELVMALAEPRQILSVTHLAQDEAESPYWRRARRYRRNDGSLLSVTPMRPDLVLTMGSGGRDRLRLASRLGISTLDLPYPTSLDDIARSLSRVARALGRPQAAAPWLTRLDALRRATPVRSRDAIWLGDGGRTIATTSLEAQWMRLAGLRQRRINGDRVPLEMLIARPPEVLLRIDYRQGQYSTGRRWLGHPLARRARPGQAIVSDGRAWTCMGPLMLAEIERLRGAVR